MAISQQKKPGQYTSRPNCCFNVVEVDIQIQPVNKHQPTSNNATANSLPYTSICDISIHPWPTNHDETFLAKQSVSTDQPHTTRQKQQPTKGDQAAQTQPQTTVNQSQPTRTDQPRPNTTINNSQPKSTNHNRSTTPKHSHKQQSTKANHK